MVANDCHNWDEPHPEKKLFPPHALAGTKGGQTVLKDVIENATVPSVTLKKTRYSAFYHTGLADMLRASGVEKLYLAGVCSDLCVFHSAIEAYNEGFDTVILGDCIASFNAQGHEFALAHVKNVLGFDIITSRDI